MSHPLYEFFGLMFENRHMSQPDESLSQIAKC